MKTFIEVSTTFTGTHYWLHAPDSVSFLRTEHRHLFTLKAKIEVKHTDRDSEFFLTAERIRYIMRDHFCPGGVTDFRFGEMSCEMIAELMFGNLSQNDVEVVSIWVYEDNENGGGVER